MVTVLCVLLVTTLCFVVFCFLGVCVYYVLNGVFFERPYELGVLVLSSFVLWLYIVLNYAISNKGPTKLVRLCFNVLHRYYGDMLTLAWNNHIAGMNVAFS